MIVIELNYLAEVHNKLFVAFIKTLLEQTNNIMFYRLIKNEELIIL